MQSTLEEICLPAGHGGDAVGPYRSDIELLQRVRREADMSDDEFTARAAEWETAFKITLPDPLPPKPPPELMPDDEEVTFVEEADEVAEEVVEVEEAGEAEEQAVEEVAEEVEDEAVEPHAPAALQQPQPVVNQRPPQLRPPRQTPPPRVSEAISPTQGGSTHTADPPAARRRWLPCLVLLSPASPQLDQPLIYARLPRATLPRAAAPPYAPFT